MLNTLYLHNIFSIKEPYHTSSPTYLYLILSSVGQKEVQTIQALTYVWNSPALSPFASIETKPVSFLCFLQPFLNLPESCLFSPQNLITEVLGVLHHLLAGGPADNLRPSPCDSGQSTRHLFLQG